MIRLANKASRSLGLAGEESVVIPVGGTVEVSEALFQDLQRNRQTRKWLEHGTVEAKTIGKRASKAPVALSQAAKAETDTEAVQGVEIAPQGGGWYRVLVNGLDVSPRSLRKDEAEALAADYR